MVKNTARAASCSCGKGGVGSSRRRSRVILDDGGGGQEAIENATLTTGMILVDLGLLVLDVIDFRANTCKISVPCEFIILEIIQELVLIDTLGVKSPPVGPPSNSGELWPFFAKVAFENAIELWVLGMQLDLCPFFVPAYCRRAWVVLE